MKAARKIHVLLGKEQQWQPLLGSQISRFEDFKVGAFEYVVQMEVFAISQGTTFSCARSLSHGVETAGCTTLKLSSAVALWPTPCV
jgi:hypothetical protein